MTVATFSPLDSLQVMAYIIKRCRDNKIHINITKLEKLLYCCYGTVLAKFDQRLTDEYPEAWPYGPVFPLTLRSIQFFTIPAFAERPTTEVEALPKVVLELIEETLLNFGKYKATELSNWTHKNGSPWYSASLGGELLYTRLSDDSIKQYFRQEVLV